MSGRQAGPSACACGRISPLPAALSRLPRERLELTEVTVARERAAVSLRQAARLAGVAGGTWRRWEQGLAVHRSSDLAMRAVARVWMPAGDLDRLLLARLLPLLPDERVAALLLLVE